MASSENAHYLASNGIPEAGILEVRKKKMRIGRTGDVRQEVLRLVEHEGVFPRTKDHKLYEGAPHQLEDGSKVICGRGGWRGALLAVVTYNLNFDPGLSADFGKLSNAWPGAETLNPAFVQVGSRSAVSQHQLIAIAHKKFIIVADQDCRYIRIDCYDGQLSVRPARREELGHLLVLRAEKYLDTHDSLTWTWYTLKRLGLLSLWSSLLAERLQKLKHGPVAAQ